MLNARLQPEAGVDWDVAAVFLGTNYGGDIEVYTRELDRSSTRLAPRPTLLYTVTEFKPNRADVNAAIRGMLAYYPNVQIIDWAQMTADDPSLLSADGYHPSPAGISRLVLETRDRARWIADRQRRRLPEQPVHRRFRRDRPGQWRRHAPPRRRPEAPAHVPRPPPTGGQTTVPQGGADHDQPWDVGHDDDPGRYDATAT